MKPPPLPPQVIYVQQAPKRTGCFTWLAAIVLIPSLLVAMWNFAEETERPPRSNGQAEPKTAAVESPKKPDLPAMKKVKKGDVVMSGQSGQRILGSCIVDATLTNTHTFAVRDIQLSAIIRGESGKRLETLNYEASITLKPGEKRKLSGLNFGPIPQQSAQIEIGVINYTGGP